MDAHLQGPSGFVIYGLEKSAGSRENGEPTGLQDVEGELRDPARASS